jgi:hypothetical protein
MSPLTRYLSRLLGVFLSSAPTGQTTDAAGAEPGVFPLLSIPCITPIWAIGASSQGLQVRVEEAGTLDK